MAEVLRSYLLLAGVWVRASAQYRVSLVLLSVTGLLSTVTDFLAVLIVFHSVRSLAGFSLHEVAFLYGTSSVCIALGDLLAGNLDRTGLKIRDGSLDAMLIRPVSPLVQLAVEQFALRRVGRLTQAAAVLAYAVAYPHWTPTRLALLVALLVSGTVIYTCLFVLGGAFQILAQDAGEVTNAFTYGGAQLTEYPLAVYSKDLVRAVTFLVPLGFINWYPALRILGHRDPFGFPPWLQFASPAVAALFALLTAVAWRAALRRYTSTGS